MTPQNFLFRVLDPGLLLVQEAGGVAPSDPARQMLLSIAQVESGAHLTARYQNSPSVSPGPARGFWQFEQAGVAGVLSHHASQSLIRRICAACDVNPEVTAIWRALEGADAFTAAVARLLLWTDPNAIPTSQDAGYQCYLRLWRPGKPDARRWPPAWQVAENTVGQVSA